MRVIAGAFKGRRLVAPDSPATRPVTDRVKESVFSSLAARIPGAMVLDLFAGAGSFGIEALSRGAAGATFVESWGKALGALRRNLEGLPAQARVVGDRVERFLQVDTGSYDIVFCDPPWPLPSTELAALLEEVRPRLAPGSVVVVTRRSSDPVPEPPGLRIADERRFGDARIIRYEMHENA